MTHEIPDVKHWRASVLLLSSALYTIKLLYNSNVSMVTDAI